MNILGNKNQLHAWCQALDDEDNADGRAASSSSESWFSEFKQMFAWHVVDNSAIYQSLTNCNSWCLGLHSILRWILPDRSHSKTCLNNNSIQRQPDWQIKQYVIKWDKSIGQQFHAGCRDRECRDTVLLRPRQRSFFRAVLSVFWNKCFQSGYMACLDTNCKSRCPRPHIGRGPRCPRSSCRRRRRRPRSSFTSWRRHRSSWLLGRASLSGIKSKEPSSI